MVPIHLTFLGMLLLVSKDYFVDAILCHVCAPIPDFQETCLDYNDGSTENCGPTTEFCHVLFREYKEPKGGRTEIFRNCGKYKGPFAAGDNECKDFATSDGGTARVCNCMQDKCNIQAINAPQYQNPTQEPHKPSVPVVTLPPSRTQAAVVTSTARNGSVSKHLAFSSLLQMALVSGSFFLCGFLNWRSL